MLIPLIPKINLFTIYFNMNIAETVKLTTTTSNTIEAFIYRDTQRNKY